MALKKEIILENGISMNYHRIAEIQNVVNGKTILVIYSYVNQNQRNREKNNQLRYSDDIYKIIDRVITDYNDKLDIVSAYEYLKTIENYKDAEDIFEDDEIKNKEGVELNGQDDGED